MSIGGYKIRNKEEIHFITFAVVEWVDVFTRKQYRDIVIDSLKRCQRKARYFLIPPCFACHHVFLFTSSRPLLVFRVFAIVCIFTNN
jgi:hypothetical protein